MDWQTGFNALLTIAISVTGAGLGYILNQIKAEFARIDKRIDELKTSNEGAHKDFRVDHTTCQMQLPNSFVTRREYEANQAALRSSLDEIKSSIKDIYEILRQRP
jgi:hypothetical protein